MSKERCPWGFKGSADCTEHGVPNCDGYRCGCDAESLLQAGKARFEADRAEAADSGDHERGAWDESTGDPDPRDVATKEATR